MTRVVEQLFCRTAFFRTTILQRTFRWLLVIIDMFMLLHITGLNKSWIIVLPKGTVMPIWKSANMYSYKTICQRFHSIIPFILWHYTATIWKYKHCYLGTASPPALALEKFCFRLAIFSIFFFLNRYSI